MIKSGFVSLIGKTNAGKSSLLNYLVDEKLSLVSHKINATRRRINGIVMHNNNQIIFVDTPGLHKSDKLINQVMIEVAISSINDCDLVLFVASIKDDLEYYENFIKLNQNVKHIVILTKIDLVSDEFVFKKILEYQKYQDVFLSLIPTTIKKKIYKNKILDEVCKFLPLHSYYYDPEFLSTTNTRDIYRDFILEAIFNNTNSEIPYSCDVIITKVKEDKNLVKILANIITDTKSHRQILIGKGGECIKRIGISARKLIENFTNCKIYIKLDIIVKKDWKNNKFVIKEQFIY